MSQVVSVVIHEGGDSSGRVLAVRRPDEPGEAYRGMWGLPAATVGEGETLEQAVERLGRQKLGMTLEIVREIARGSQEREDGDLSMVLYEVRAQEKEPKLARAWDPQGVTYYTKWRWAEPSMFESTAKAGSLCCRLFLDSQPASES